MESIDPNQTIAEYASSVGVSEKLVKDTIKLGRLPVVTFAAGGIATPADAAMMMKLGLDGVFVGSGIFKSSNPEARAGAIVSAVINFHSPKVLAEVSENIGQCMESLNLNY